MPAVLDRPLALPVLDPLSPDATAARGAAWLDERVPGWAERINPDWFTIASCTKCVLGQLFGHYGIGLVKLDLMKDSDWLGFSINEACGPAYCGQLDEAWRREISGRR